MNFCQEKITVSEIKNKSNIHTTHPYHLVDASPWPILMSFALLSGALLLVNWLTLGETN